MRLLSTVTLVCLAVVVGVQLAVFSMLLHMYNSTPAAGHLTALHATDPKVPASAAAGRPATPGRAPQAAERAKPKRSAGINVVFPLVERPDAARTTAASRSKVRPRAPRKRTVAGGPQRTAQQVPRITQAAALPPASKLPLEGFTFDGVKPHAWKLPNAIVSFGKESPTLLRTSFDDFGDGGLCNKGRNVRINHDKGECVTFRNVAFVDGDIHLFGVSHSVAHKLQNSLKFMKDEARSSMPKPRIVAHPKHLLDATKCANTNGSYWVPGTSHIYISHRLYNNFHLLNSNVIPLFYDILYSQGPVNLSTPQRFPDTQLHPHTRRAFAEPHTLWMYFSKMRYDMAKLKGLAMASLLNYVMGLSDTTFPSVTQQTQPYQRLYKGMYCMQKLHYGPVPWPWTEHAHAFSPAYQGVAYELQKYMLSRLKIPIRRGPPVPNSLPRIIYIKRGCRGVRRCIRNADDIQKAAQRYHKWLKVDVCCGNWSDVKGILARVAQADIGIGVHGAGFANLLWMRPGSIIMELQPKFNKNYFDKFARQMNFTWVTYDISSFKAVKSVHQPRLRNNYKYNFQDHVASDKQLYDIVDHAMDLWWTLLRNPSYRIKRALYSRQSIHVTGQPNGKRPKAADIRRPAVTGVTAAS